MTRLLRRVAVVGVAILGSLLFGTAVTPAQSNAAECGPGTFYDAASNSCLVAAPPPPPPAPPPAWNGDLTPYFSVGVCAPIPFVSLCTGI